MKKLIMMLLFVFGCDTESYYVTPFSGYDLKLISVRTTIYDGKTRICQYIIHRGNGRGMRGGEYSVESNLVTPCDNDYTNLIGKKIRIVLEEQK